jgi:hypothetical protein
MTNVRSSLGVIALGVIGNGSGRVIGLSRALGVGDVLTVIQQRGACRSQNAHRVTVRAPGQ